MFHSKGRSWPLLIPAFCAFFSSAQSFAAVSPVPTPPPTICIDDKCTQSPSPSPSSSSAIRFNPGHYAWYDGIIYKDGQFANKKTNLLALIDSIANEPAIQGVQVTVQWAVLEGDIAGDYSAGFAFIDEVIARCAKYGKKLMLVFGNYQIGYFSAPGTISFPKYLLSSAYGAVQSANANGYRSGGVVAIPSGTYAFLANGEISAAFWETKVADRVIALQAAYGARYNNNPALEMWSPVANLAFTTPYNTFGYSRAATATQLARILTAARQSFPNTAVRLWIDYFDNDAGTAAVLKQAETVDTTIGGNDVLPNEDITADRVFNGEGGTTDYRGIVPWVSNIAYPELCGKEGTFTPEQLYNHAMNGNSSKGIAPQRPQYFAWVYNVSICSAGSVQRWSTGILPFIRSISGAVSNGLDSTRRSPSSVKASYCPKGYDDGCK